MSTKQYKNTLTHKDKKYPKTGPYSVGDNIHKKTGPGIANACKSIYK